MYKFLISFSLIFLLFSCDNDSEVETRTSVQGKVMDIESQDSLVGATVYFLKSTPGNPASAVVFDQTTTDTLGEFEYTFDADPAYHYFAYSMTGNYLFDHFEVVQIGRTNTLNIQLLRPGYLLLHIKNTSPFDTLDLIEFIDSDFYDHHFSFTGNTIDTTILITSFGNKTNPVSWKVTKNDTTTSYNQSFNYISLDTLTFDLFY